MPKAADLSDTQFVREQYQSSKNLDARISLHQRFSVNEYGWHRWIFDHLDFPARCRILELGCGPGTLWVENVGRIARGWQIFLSDLSAGMLQQARENLQRNGHPWRFGLVDAQSIPFRDQSLDGIVANHMLYHVPDAARALSEIRRALRPGGRLYASTVGQGHLREIRDLVRRFDPRLSLWGRQAPDSFSLENGAAQLEGWFASVTLARYSDALIVTEPTPLVDYILSGTVELTADEQGAFAAFVKQEFQRHGGTFPVAKDSGLFVASALQ